MYKNIYILILIVMISTVVYGYREAMPQSALDRYEKERYLIAFLDQDEIVIGNWTFTGNVTFLNITVVNESFICLDDVCIDSWASLNVTDTNASTECNDGEYLDGDSNCYNFNNTVSDLSSADTNCSVPGSCPDVAYMNYANNGVFYSDEISAPQNWTDNQNYPVRCPADTVIVEVGDSNICVQLSYDNISQSFNVVQFPGGINSSNINVTKLIAEIVNVTQNLSLNEGVDINLLARNSGAGLSGSKIAWFNGSTEVARIEFNYFPTGQVLGLNITSDKAMRFGVPEGFPIYFDGRTRWEDDKPLEIGSGAFDKGDYEFYFDGSNNSVVFRAGLSIAPPSKVHWNQYMSDTDFQISGDNDLHMFYANAEYSRVGIGTKDPNYKLDVNGTTNASKYLAQSSNISNMTTDNITWRGKIQYDKRFTDRFPLKQIEIDVEQHYNDSSITNAGIIDINWKEYKDITNKATDIIKLLKFKYDGTPKYNNTGANPVLFSLESNYRPLIVGGKDVRLSAINYDFDVAPGDNSEASSEFIVSVNKYTIDFGAATSYLESPSNLIYQDVAGSYTGDLFGIVGLKDVNVTYLDFNPNVFLGSIDAMTLIKHNPTGTIDGDHYVIDATRGNIKLDDGQIQLGTASVYPNYAVCYLNNGTLGHCTNAVNASGGCSCSPN